MKTTRVNMRFVLLLLILSVVPLSGQKGNELFSYKTDSLIYSDENTGKMLIKFRYQYPFFSINPFGINARAINNLIFDSFDLDMQYKFESMIEAYKRTRKIDPSYSELWSIEEYILVTFLNSRMMGIDRLYLSFLKGVMPVIVISSLNIENNTARVLQFDDFFAQGSKDSIIAIAERCFLKKYFDGKAPASYKSNGFMFDHDKFILPDIISTDGKSFIFRYQPEEYTPAEYGIVEIRVPLSDLEPYINRTNDLILTD